MKTNKVRAHEGNGSPKGLFRVPSPSESYMGEKEAIGHQVDDISREAWAMRNGGAFLVPGYVLLTELSSQGGSTAEDYRSDMDVKNATHKISFSKKVDNVELEQMAIRVIAGARYLLDTHAAKFFSGAYFAPEEEFDALDKALAESRADAEACNEMAKKIGSERRTIVDIYPLVLDPANKRMALRLGASIHKRLITLRESYTSPVRRGFQTAMQSCTKLDQLVGGSQRQMIQLALRSSDAQRPLMIAHYGGRKGGAALKREFGDNLPDFDYGPIDAAIALFAPSTEVPSSTKGRSHT